MEQIIQQQTSSQYRIVIPENVETTIREYCAMCPRTEWSGVLFYGVEGTFEDNNLTIICKDILLMDEGSSGHTVFRESPEIIKYQFDNDLIENTYQGLIHSHNQMSAFFSGEDNGTLLKEGNDRNHFVSLVVNNAGNYVARITRRLTATIKSHVIQSTSITYPTFENVTKVISEEEITEYDAKDEVKTKIEYTDLIIEKANVTIHPNKYLARLWDIRKNPRTGGSVQPYKTPQYSGTTPSYNVPAVSTKYQTPSISPKPEVKPSVTKDKPGAYKNELTYEEMTSLRCSAEITDTVVKQLLTGCIVPNDQITLEQLDCSAVEKYFTSYFGTTDYGKKRFEEFASIFCTYIIENTYDEDILDMYDIYDGDMQEVLARSVIERLQEFRCTNYYIQTYIKELSETYIEVLFNDK